MRTLPVLFILFLLTAGCAGTQKGLFAPSDIEVYCRKILGGPDADNEAVYQCIQQERSAKDQLAEMNIPPEVEKRCRKLSDSTGGSYQVMLTCVQQEMPVKKKGK
ncbi:MAG: hypothetical protein HZB61_07455 [Nitrospirae bacterium]|nr:hypothetical protein [Nitrospirota bacterium]